MRLCRDHVGVLEIGIDNKGVIQWLEGNRQKAADSEAGDFVRGIHHIQDSWRGELSLIKVKSHADDEDFANGLPHGLWLMKLPTFWPLGPVATYSSVMTKLPKSRGMMRQLELRFGGAFL